MRWGGRRVHVTLLSRVRSVGTVVRVFRENGRYVVQEGASVL